ncbi:MAG TPA: redoxin domain-containing protein [Pirellulales bacterium]|jgi:peroxiredoxin|nr:redoxin domain-containing protein [Pirellulales bacterium]
MHAKLFALVVLAALASADARAEQPKSVIGKRVDNFTLKDFRGQPFSLAENAKGKVVVLAFLGTECPLAKLYAPRLVELAKQYESKGVVFIGVDSNRQDAITEIDAFARAHEIKFPVLKDLNQVLADQVGATRTPEVVVLDRDRVIRYRGRIDDQYGFVSNMNYQKPAPSERNLGDALEAITSGKKLASAETQVAGCLIGRDRKPVANSDVTYTNQIARIMNANCVYCHREGQIAPFSLTNYEEVAGWAGMIDEVVQAERMPPWHADARYGHFENDARLSAADKATISKWVANGAPQGNSKDLPEPPKFAEGWMIPKPDQVLYMADKGFDVPATGVVPYQMFVVDPGWKEDKWITAIEPRPGNHSVVHHILLFVIPPDGNINGGIGSGNDFLGAFAPGLRPEPLVEGLARFVQAGSKLIFQMHYTPNGTAQQDRSYCGFVFADPKSVKKEVRVTSAVNAVFEIPPGDGNFNVKARYIFRDDSMLLTLMPHMHLRGKAFRYEATYPDGKHEVLLDVPRYDFGWQTSYRLAEPKFMPRGTRMDCLAAFDNSEDNLNNPDPKSAVRFGDQTFEEMMIGFFEMSLAHEDRQHPEKSAKPLSRIEQFNVIMAATKGEPDDNVKVGAYMALAQPEIFRQFGFILRTMVPQVDRLDITGLQDGKLVEVMGPFAARQVDKDKGGDEEVERIISEAKKNAQKNGKAEVAESIYSPLPPTDPTGESLAEYAAGSKVVVNNDLSKAKGKMFEIMAKRGAKSSMHVPAEIKGQKVTVNFWSTDAGAFPPPAEAVLTGVAQIMTAPKEKTQAAAR